MDTITFRLRDQMWFPLHKFLRNSVLLKLFVGISLPRISPKYHRKYFKASSNMTIIELGFVKMKSVFVLRQNVLCRILSKSSNNIKCMDRNLSMNIAATVEQKYAFFRKLFVNDSYVQVYKNLTISLVVNTRS